MMPIDVDVAALMGKVVIVEFVYKRYCSHGGDNSATKYWERVQATARPGWVVGRRNLQQGVAHYGYGYDDPPTWSQTGPTTPCLLVCYWPTMKPVKVPLDGWRPAPETIMPYVSASGWKSTWRRNLRNEMVHWPRNQRGQWEKKNK